MKLVTLTQETKKDLLNHLLKRSPNNYGAFEERVQAIIQEVRVKGDEALFAYTKQFDKVELTAETIRVTPEEIEEAYREVEPSLLDVIRKSLVNIRSYHEKQKKYSWFDTTENGIDPWTEGDTAWNGRGLCTGGKGRLPVFGSDECRPGQGRRRRTDRYDDAARQRRKDSGIHTRGGA